MRRHYNIYYLFLEDKAENPMPERRSSQIRENIEKFYEKIKPPWPAIPPNIRTGERAPEKNQKIER